MSDDHLLDSLRADWKRQPGGLERIRRHVAWRERAVRLWTWFGDVGIVLALVMAGWFTVRAWATGDALWMLGAAGLLVALPVMVAEQWWLHRRKRPGDLSTPRALVDQLHRQAEVSLRLLRGCRLAAAILFGCAAAAWVLSAAGQIERSSAVFVSLLWIGTAALLLLWYRWRRHRVLAELAECGRLSAEFRAAE